MSEAAFVPHPEEDQLLPADVQQFVSGMASPISTQNFFYRIDAFNKNRDSGKPGEISHTIHKQLSPTRELIIRIYDGGAVEIEGIDRSDTHSDAD